VITSIKLWNEPNNLSHWDFLLDPEWTRFAEMVRMAAGALRDEGCSVPLVLGGLSPIDPDFFRRMERLGVLDAVDVLAVHGFPLDWNLWPLEEWPARLAAIRAEFGKPVWITETGVSSFATEEVGAWGLRRSLEILRGERVFWYTLLDLAPEFEATTRHKKAEGSSYHRHFHFGLLRWNGVPKRALEAYDPAFGLCQWFQYGDERTLKLAVDWLGRLGVREVRSGLSWAESHVPGAWEWFDTVMDALAPFDVCLTLCFTPPSRGIRPDITAPPQDPGEFAWFAAETWRRYGARRPAPSLVPASILGETGAVLAGPLADP
jgi:beta-xylosidase